MTRTRESAQKAPLDGIRVLDVGDFISGPCCSMMMADLGAQVIKIEPPGAGDSSRRYGPFIDDAPGPDRSGLYLYLNRNKLGVTLDVKTDAGRELLDRLVAVSDILVHNTSGGLEAGPGPDAKRLWTRNPQMIVVAISPFGSSGPRSHWKARDINLTAASGYSAAVGLPEKEPLGFPVPVAQINAGIYAASAALAALCVRDLHGVGQLVDISEVESLATVHTGEEVLMWLHGWRSTQRMGLGTQAGSGFSSHTFACKDGRVFLDTARNHQWRTLVSMTGHQAFEEDPRFLEVAGIDQADWPEARDHVETWMADITKHELFDQELQHQMGIAPELDVGEVCRDPDLSAFFLEIGSDHSRKIRAPGLPFRFGGLGAQTPRPAPRLGEHNEEVFCHLLGVPLTELAGMSRNGVV